MMRQIVSEGWGILRSRAGVSIALALALAVPLALGGFAVVVERWLAPLVATEAHVEPVQVLLRPDATGQRLHQWVDAQHSAHPNWQIEVVPPEKLADRLSQWFPYFRRIMDRNSLEIMPPLVEIVAPNPAALAGLENNPEVLAVGPRSNLGVLLRSALTRVRLVLGMTSLLLFAAAGLLAAVWVHLEMYRHADEITVMRLVGTTEGAVRGPFLVVVGATGVLAGAVSSGLTHVLTIWSSGVLGILGLQPPVVPWWLSVVQVVAAVALPTAAAAITLARHATFGIEE